MADSRILLVGAKERLWDDLSAALEPNARGGLLADEITTVHQAIERLSERGYDAVVCWVERDDELAGVIRIRKLQPELPIMVLTSRDDPQFEELAKQAGATRTVRPERNVANLSEFIRLAAGTGEVRSQVLANPRGGHPQARKVRVLAERSRTRVKKVKDTVGRFRIPEFVPLLVLEDPERADLMLQAFEKAEIFAPLPILKSGEEAIAFLTAAPGSEKTENHPHPTIVLVDFERPGKGSIGVVEGIRAAPGIPRLPVILLGLSADPQHLIRAYESGANSYLTKPSSFPELVELLKTLKRYWGRMNEHFRR